MKKLVWLVIILFVGLAGQVSAVEYTGFLTQLSVPAVKELNLVNVASKNASGVSLSIMSFSNQLSTVNFSVLCNYDNWHVIAYSADGGMKNGSHVIPLQVSAVALNAAAGTYTTLATSATVPTVADASNTLLSGNFIGSSGSGTSYSMYIKPETTAFAARRGGFYSTFINLQILDNI